MKVGVWLSKSYKPHEGGGFSYYDVLIDAIDKKEFKSTEVIFISTETIKNGLHKQVVKIPKINYLCFSLLKYLVHILPSKISILFNNKIEQLLTTCLKKEDVQVIYYPTQSDAIISHFPFISNNWDIGHRSTYAFPELVYDGQFEKRERWYQGKVQKAILVFCESQAGKRELIRFTGIVEEKVKVVPTFPGRTVETVVSGEDQELILKKYQLIKNEFFFYPAQFWAHKNHYGLLNAFSKFNQVHSKMKLVLTGADKGNLQYIKNLVKKMNLENNVVFCGFVTNSEIVTFYKNALALVMTTFFGPTNMPLLEALVLNCPVLCTDLEGHREMLKDAALYFNPTDYVQIAASMEKILDKKYREGLLFTAKKVLENNCFNINYAIKEMEKHFEHLNTIRYCWA